MMKRSGVRVIGDPVLREKAREVSPLGEDRESLNQLLARMFDILREEEGLGLAAPQVGESVRVFVALPDYLEELKGHTVFLNPVVEPYGPLEKREEGCLSIPGIYETLDRPGSARITATDENGERFTLDLSGLAARLVQHETDHLDGILFVDRLSPMKKRFLRRKLRSMMEQAETC
jgi:peptide deformylase